MSSKKLYLISFLLILLIISNGVISFKAKGEDNKYSPFTGNYLDKSSYQKGVMAIIENSPQARPQSGLNSASIVYEYPVEGGITRFLALYWGGIPDKVGPIRSARPYLIKTAQSYNALLLHAGASPDGFKILQNENVDNLDQIYNGNYYWRGKTKKPPHNLYTGFSKIDDYLTKKSSQEYNVRFNFKEFSFVNSEEIAAEKLVIDYWGNYDVIYKYDFNENSYDRYINNLENPHLNQNNKQINVKNIIIKFTDTTIIDGEGRLNVKINGEGKAYYFFDGNFTEGKWEKKEGEWTKFYSAEDELIEVNAGNTWIQVVANSMEITYQRGESNGEKNKK
ncbi:MAG: DUF3048 domain-containing protein [Bacillota bacterium]